MTGTEDERVLQILNAPHPEQRVLEMLAQAVDYGWILHGEYINGSISRDFRNPYSGKPMTEIHDPLKR